MAIIEKKCLTDARAEALLKNIVNHIVTGKNKVRQIWQLKAMGFENDDLLCFGYTQQDLEKASGKKKYQVTAGGYATQNGIIMVPAYLPAREVNTYIGSHLDEIEFGEPHIDRIDSYNFQEVHWEI
jgi:hypothetical protein